MSVGNPKKFEKLSKIKNVVKQVDGDTKGEVTKVYKDKNYEAKRALRFKTDNNKSKLT